MPTEIVGYIPNTPGPGRTAKVCQSGGVPKALAVTPDGNRLFLVCQDDPNNTVEVWNVSQADGSLVGSDTLLTIPIASITLPSPEMPRAAGGQRRKRLHDAG
jgi:DNA-binding beta-propeller fold protein YncE